MQITKRRPYETPKDHFPWAWSAKTSHQRPIRRIKPANWETESELIISRKRQPRRQVGERYEHIHTYPTHESRRKLVSQVQRHRRRLAAFAPTQCNRGARLSGASKPPPYEDFACSRLEVFTPTHFRTGKSSWQWRFCPRAADRDRAESNPNSFVGIVRITHVRKSTGLSIERFGNREQCGVWRKSGCGESERERKGGFPGWDDCRDDGVNDGGGDDWLFGRTRWVLGEWVPKRY